MMGLRIAALRQSRNMSQSDLARQLGVSPSAVGMYEQGRREPPLRVVQDIAEFFGVSLDYLIAGKTETPLESAAVEQLVDQRVQILDSRLAKRPQRPFSRQELAVLLSALLSDT